MGRRSTLFRRDPAHTNQGVCPTAGLVIFERVEAHLPADSTPSHGDLASPKQRKEWLMENTAKALDAGAALSGTVDEIRNEATPGFRRAAARAQAMGKQGVDAATEFAGRARDTVSSASQSVLDYTRENPVKALAIAAVSGAVLVTLAKAIKASRD
jgi:ElaB/YqjD/DUF883 family membrane-anchored ribosome-binding protein